MNCPTAIEQIIAQGGRTSVTTEVENHLWACPGCARVYVEQQALWRAMEEWEAPEVTVGFDRRLFERIGKTSLRTPWGWLARFLRPWQPAFSAALAGVLLLAAAVIRQGRDIPAPQAQAVVQSFGEEVEQVETALDDIHMLHELEIAPEPAGEGDC